MSITATVSFIDRSLNGHPPAGWFRYEPNGPQGGGFFPWEFARSQPRVASFWFSVLSSSFFFYFIFICFSEGTLFGVGLKAPSLGTPIFSWPPWTHRARWHGDGHAQPLGLAAARARGQKRIRESLGSLWGQSGSLALTNDQRIWLQENLQETAPKHPKSTVFL